MVDLFEFWCFNATFSNIMVTSFIGGGSRSTQTEPSTLGKQLVNFSLAAASRVHPFL
jgi:hypothetical protein